MPEMLDTKNNNNTTVNEETNIEGIAAELLSRMPFDDPEACRDIFGLMKSGLDRLLTHRAERHARDERKQRKR
jgi:hypothetical protein